MVSTIEDLQAPNWSDAQGSKYPLFEICLSPMTKAPTPTENPKSNETTQKTEQNIR